MRLLAFHELDFVHVDAFTPQQTLYVVRHRVAQGHRTSKHREHKHNVFAAAETPLIVDPSPSSAPSDLLPRTQNLSSFLNRSPDCGYLNILKSIAIP